MNGIWTGRFKRVFVASFVALLSIGDVFGASAESQIAALKAQRTEAIFRVQQIVNQPVTHLKRTPDMNVRVFSPGWFHEGANTPSFDKVDVRVTQEFPYQGRKYVTSDLNPGEVFLGDELEFNSMTKYFYTTRNVPKKKLTEAEMVEINTLYRTIGRCDRQIEELQNPPPFWAKAHQWALANKSAVVGAVVVLILLLIFVRKLKSKEAVE